MLTPSDNSLVLKISERLEWLGEELHTVMKQKAHLAVENARLEGVIKRLQEHSCDDSQVNVRSLEQQLCWLKATTCSRDEFKQRGETIAQLQAVIDSQRETIRHLNARLDDVSGFTKIPIRDGFNEALEKLDRSVYRLLVLGDRLQAGDEWLDGDGHWTPTHVWGGPAKIINPKAVVRRKISQ